MDAQKSGKEKSAKAKRKIAARNRRAELRSHSAARTPGAESVGAVPTGPPADCTARPESSVDEIALPRADNAKASLSQIPPRQCNMDAQKSGKEKSAKAKRKIAARNRRAELRSHSAARTPGAESVGAVPAGPPADCTARPESSADEIALPRADNAKASLSQIPPRIEKLSYWLYGPYSSSCEFEVKVSLRQALSIFHSGTFGRYLNTDLLEWGTWYVSDEGSPKSRTVDVATRNIFSSFNPGRGFSGAVGDVMTDYCDAGTETLLLDLLLEVAKRFTPSKRLLASRAEGLTWSSSLSEQYFVLCKNIVEWNRTTFHPDLRSKENMEKMKRLGEQGAFTIEGINVQNLITEVFLY